MRVLTGWDMVLIVTAVVFAGVIAFWGPRIVTSEADTVEIRSGNSSIAVYPLGQDRTIHSSGPLGTTVVIIRNGRVSVASSPCRDHLCVKMGSIGKEGGVIACVPNEVVIRVRSCNPEPYDAVLK
jgi:hypothetical protein